VDILSEASLAVSYRLRFYRFSAAREGETGYFSAPWRRRGPVANGRGEQSL